jgi:hypothetical protein
MKKILSILFVVLILVSSCASPKTFVIDGQRTEVKPYGWANKESRYNEQVVYEVNLGNVIWSAIGIETIVLPVWLTGWQLFEPVRLKTPQEVEGK